MARRAYDMARERWKRLTTICFAMAPHSLSPAIGDIEALRVRFFDPERSRSRTICVVVSQNSSKLTGSWGCIADGIFARK